uniref:Urocanate hydratase 1 n=1 Tax=Marmota marmota marmota TaxID=9994 RepID=A0A8C5ZHD9_MARMA
LSSPPSYQPPASLSLARGLRPRNGKKARHPSCLFPSPAQLALRNALRYFPPDIQKLLAPEFAQELRLYGHIYMYRFCPTIQMRAYPLQQYPSRTRAAAAIMHMIMNNLDPAVAQYPQELVTYGGNGQVFSNWAQFWLTMSYLSKMTEDQTLVMYSGHPLGLFPSSPGAPRLVITNGMVIPNYSSRTEYEKLFALGVTIGQRGPYLSSLQLTVLNAGRRYLGVEDLAGKVFVTSGLGGMSGAQAKAAVILGCIAVIAEVSSLSSPPPPPPPAPPPPPRPLPCSLRRHVSAINHLAQENFFFWDYGNAFLLEAQRAGADVEKKGANKTEFRYPSYVQHIMGDIFSQGFGPFRWVCTSGDPEDLAVTDQLATSVLEKAIAEGATTESVKLQYMDNVRWIREAAKHHLVVGSQARILYSDQKGRVAIAVAINQAIASGKVKAPVILSRDHHDVSGTDSPFRETSNIYDGSAFCADMAVQNFVGDACRGATWVALHNGGGVGWGEVINGGFGLVLDGTPEAEQKARAMLSWDVSNGVARRCWSGNPKAYEIICQTMRENDGLEVTLPHPVADEGILQQALRP